ncbi:hypothetical protein DWX95_09955 [Butyricicoccus sp. AF22-28AC]|nr:MULTISPECIES: ABC transporter substrate-binding protein [unclassified Butyricicoccus]RGM77868.1 hypothetical protein DXB94_08720 [Butyricicoccus sp. OM06-6AC]RHQ81349.1 hypothetical protein DWX95_09955 [Butyricicoccus sp. AF22-28AC]
MKKNGILFRAASGLLAAALTLSLTACGGSSSNSDASAAADSGATHLRLIYSPSLCAAPMYIAIENGYFEDEGLDIEQVTVDAAHVSEAIGADQVDVGMGLIGKMLQPLENGLPIKFTTGLHTGCTKLLVPGDSDIKSVADLKGKKIGVPGLADAATVISKRSLSAAGISVTDQNMEVEFSVYSRNDLAQALQNGAVDAIALGDPAASIAEEQYGLTALIDTATDPEYKDEYCCAAFVTSKLAEENPRLQQPSPVPYRRHLSGYRKIRTRPQRSSPKRSMSPVMWTSAHRFSRPTTTSLRFRAAMTHSSRTPRS